MSILIKGMAMPKNCEECPFCLGPFVGEISGAIKMSCFVTYHIVCPTVDGYPDDCPLIEVPPHGRLIDADAAAKQGWTISRTYSASPTETVYEVKTMTDEVLPTIIKAEE